MNRGIVTGPARQTGVVWGMLSILALVAMVVTVPVALVVAGGWPLAHLGVRHVGRAVSSSRSFDPHLVAAWLSRGALVVAWLCWTWMTVCVLLELRSWATGHLPVRLPGSRTLQSVAACLVGTALALSAGRVWSAPDAMARTGPSVAGSPPVGVRVIDDLVWPAASGPAVGAGGTAPLSFGATAPESARSPGPRSGAEPPTATATATTAADGSNRPAAGSVPRTARPLAAVGEPRTSPGSAGRLHQVLPRETLWSIATEKLGSSLLWKELANLNYGIRQADGGELTADHWISAGWLLRLPAAPNGMPVADDGPVPRSDDGGVGRADSTSQDGRGRSIPEERPSQPSRPAPPALDAKHVASDTGRDHRCPNGQPLAPVGGSVVGAGVVSILDRMRRAQQRHRASGRLITLPDRSRGIVERRLRIGDGSEVTAVIDSSLRLLFQRWHDSPGEVPVVRGARVTDETIELVVDGLDPGLGLPDFCVAGADGTSILVDRAAVGRRPRSAPPGRGPRSPAPLMVTAGRGTDDALMVNLEVLGSLVVEGDELGCDSVVRALALELATSFWAGQFELVVVGFGSELERFTRVTSTTDSPTLVRTLCRRRIHAHQVLSSTGFRTYAEARGTVGSERWDPVVVICGSSMADSEVAEVLEAGSDAEVAMAVIAVGPSGGASHAVTLGGSGPAASLGLLGSVVSPQMISAEDAVAVTDLLDTAASLETVPMSAEPYVHLSVPVPGLAADPAGTSIGMGASPAERSPVTGVTGSGPSTPPDGLAHGGEVVVRVLGAVEVLGAAREFTRAWAKELVVYLAMHPNGAANEAWATALWPDRMMAPSSLHSTASVARRALGQSPGGQDHLPRSHGRLAVGPSVVTDWEQFVALADSDRVEDRRSALHLVRGRPFEGLRSSDWPILEGIGPAIEAAIVDLSGRLAGTYLAAGDPNSAEWSARKGLLASPYDERLYRMLMRAADLAGNPAGVESVMAELVKLVADDVEPFDSVHPSTIDLYRSLTRHRPKSTPRT
jgi:DNA-binding SARP family transcriptional activator